VHLYIPDTQASAGLVQAEPPVLAQHFSSFNSSTSLLSGLIWDIFAAQPHLIRHRYQMDAMMLVANLTQMIAPNRPNQGFNL
jgi:hypothetical protein